MEQHAGIDVSLEWSSVCIVDAGGKIVREIKVASEPEVLVEFFKGLSLPVTSRKLKEAIRNRVAARERQARRYLLTRVASAAVRSEMPVWALGVKLETVASKRWRDVADTRP